jgi:hypothetical protein
MPAAGIETTGMGRFRRDRAVQNLKLFIAVAACNALILAGGYAAADWSVHSRIKGAADAVVNRAAKQDRLDIGHVLLASAAIPTR